MVFVTQLLGYFFLLVASISSSVSMNFQKLAQYELQWKDPRTRQHKRRTKLKSYVFMRPLFVLAIFLSFAASTMDFLALTWLPPMTVGIFGAVSIIVNLLVSKVILFEQPDTKEMSAIACVIIGCILAISSKITGNDEQIPPKLIERTSSCVYIIMNWMLFITCSIILEYCTLTPKIHRFGFPFISGALGAQNVCMGKYIAWTVARSTEIGELAVRLDVFCSVLLLCIASIIIHIIWLNKGLAKHDAYYCIIVYQSSWFLFTTLSGIVVYDNMATLSVISHLCFFSGCALAMIGVWKISLVHKDSNET